MVHEVLSYAQKIPAKFIT